MGYAWLQAMAAICFIFFKVGFELELLSVCIYTDWCVWFLNAGRGYDTYLALGPALARSGLHS